jgi:mediator of RNA polymerase II transcription subunit 22
VDNFEQVLKLVKVEPETNLSAARIQESTYEMRVRAANMTRAAESIMKLIWDIKQYLIINDFPLINDTISNQTDYSKMYEIDSKLASLRDEISNELYDLEDEYYNSLVK